MLKKVLIFAILLTAIVCGRCSFADEVALSSSPAEVCFTPGGPCTEDIIKVIAGATKSVFVQAYSFTSEPIADALIAAHKRGVKVEALFDKSQEKAPYSLVSDIFDAGIPAYIDKKHAIAHNKVMIIDKGTVITGSFNFTYAAENKNAENVIIIKSTDLAKSYLKNFIEHKSHSVKFRGGR